MLSNLLFWLVLRTSHVGKRSQDAAASFTSGSCTQRGNRKTEFNNLVADLRKYDPELHFQHFRMTLERFDDSLLQPLLIPKKCHASPITPAGRLSLTIR